ncbi:uncharacterized protein PHACADRAFT_251210 [Phanerochaete carnosa HHB-10118-sp]|uniref:Uncharacterized protein n=1 Tax=Phanerochaete carnosa (strain HHB-10118-sp) TaxID=650164 RepID=K5WEN7_PHACS|nr:uncharacterized protein PHACADRAFT_251210 [Phanerochaete carnosa HHB-10118-sp]EKM57534.1 hypothetical protein PHACADRAFT_251210 [Phanerochaete carnosa HHB-10118-sp]
MSSLANSKPLAMCAVGGSLATLGYMYVAGKQSKTENQPASIYKTEEQGAGLTSGQTDARLGSKEIREAVHGDRKP